MAHIVKMHYFLCPPFKIRGHIVLRCWLGRGGAEILQCENILGVKNFVTTTISIVSTLLNLWGTQPYPQQEHNHIQGTYTPYLPTLSIATHNHIHGGYTNISILDTQLCPWQHGGYTTISMVGKQPCPWQYTPYPWLVHYHIHDGTQPCPWWHTTLLMEATQPYPWLGNNHIHGGHRTMSMATHNHINGRYTTISLVVQYHIDGWYTTKSLYGRLLSPLFMTRELWTRS